MKLSGYDPWGLPSTSMMSRMILSSKSPLRNPQYLQVPNWRTPPSWHTSNKAINIKFSGYLAWDQTRSSMMSRMTLSSWSAVRNPQNPPSSHMKGPPSSQCSYPIYLQLCSPWSVTNLASWQLARQVLKSWSSALTLLSLLLCLAEEEL